MFSASRPSSILLLSLLLPAVAAGARAAPLEPPADTAPAGLCYAVGADQQRQIVPLESTEVVLDVKPGVMEAEVVQTFTNHTGSALEAIYLYPLPADATVTAFEVRYPDRVIRSVVREKSVARSTYETAKSEGKAAALLEQHDPSLFSTSVANFLPGETVKVALRFIQPLALTSQAIEVRFPMVTGTKYFPAGSVPGAPGNASPDPARRDAASLAPNHVYAFDIQVAGIPVRAITSPSHRIRVEQLDPAADTRFVTLEDTITIPDRDFVLRIESRSAEATQPTLVLQHTGSGDYGLLTAFPPSSTRRTRKQARPRDVMFVLDHSGSMEGTRLASAKRGLERCLGMLSPADRFQLCVFDDKCVFQRPAWTEATGAGLSDAARYLSGITADGGTELQAALAQALDRFEPDERDHVLVLLTDGDVGNSDSLLNLVAGRIGSARLFAFGVGAVPNAALLTQVAQLGRGQVRFIGDDGAIEREMTSLFATLGTPVLTHLQLSLLDAQGAPIEHTLLPETLPDVFLGCPIQGLFRTTGNRPAAVIVHAEADGEPVVFRLTVPATPLRGEALEKLFGRQLYDGTAALLRSAGTDPERELIRKEMLETALQFQLVTELTSRVAVEQRVVRAPSAPLQSRTVAQYTAVDENGDETIVLSPFVIADDEDHGYYASSFCGTRLRSSLQDVGSAITVVTKEFLDDIGAANAEDVLPYTTGTEIGGETAGLAGNFVALDGLPVTTPVDLATIARIGVDLDAPATGIVEQQQARPGTRSRAIARFGDEGVRLGTIEAAASGRGPGALSLLGIVSAARFEDPQWSAYLNATRRLGDTQVSGTVQARALSGYGDMRMLQVAAQHTFSDALNVGVAVAWHRLDRDDARQFAAGAPHAAFDGLGFLNLDLLTATTRRLEDAIGRIEFGGAVGSGSFRQVWSVELDWHRQESAWLAPLNEASAPARRDNSTLAADDRVAFFSDRLELRPRLARSWHRSDGETAARLTTDDVSLTARLHLTEGIVLFANGAHTEALPWIPSGLWEVDRGRVIARSDPIESRDLTELGLSAEAASARVVGEVRVFREHVADHAYRDWSWERDHAGVTELPDGALRSPIGTGLVGDYSRTGLRGSLQLRPEKSLQILARWSLASAIDAPYRGGRADAAIFAHYESFGGPLKGLLAGTGLSYRDALVFDDGYRLEGGVRWDLSAGWRLRLSHRRDALLQLNLVNVADRSWQLTRFAPDRGRQLLITLAESF